MKIGNRLCKKFGFLSQNHGLQEYLPCCSRVSLTAANLWRRSRVAAGVSDPGYSFSLGYTNHRSLLTDHSGVTGSGGDAESDEPLVLDCLWVWA